MTDSLIVTQADRLLLGVLRPHAELQSELERAIVVSSEAVPPDVVTMNSRVVYSDETSGVQRVVTIVFPGDADAADGKVSVFSPIGTALLGLSVGQAIDWDFPDGSRRRLRVDELVHQPERRLSRQPGFRIRSST
jgi:regulator of nucleoside diphosphate kinase